MAEMVCLRLDWDRSAFPLRIPSINTVHIGPEPGFPFGRKGAALLGAWKQLSGRTTDGMLILDGDVAIDLVDLAAMRTALGACPQDVHVAPVKLWPESFKGDSWVWGHWESEPSQISDDNPWRFSFCFTWIPRRVIDQAVKDGLETWTFPWVDRNMSVSARKAKVPVHVVPDCWPKHLHF